MGRKRKLFTGVAPIGGHSIKSLKKARRVTSAYHNIRNEIQQISKSLDIDEKTKLEKKAKLEAQLEDMGGTNKYQEASMLATKHFKTSRWVLTCINDYLPKPVYWKGDNRSNLDIPSKSREGRFQVLEVGAINTQLQQCTGLNVRAIDINSQHPSIEELDFFDIPPAYTYDCVVCCMVLNCVDSPSKRGEMLARLRGQLKDEQSLLLLVLPTRCVDSPHIGKERFNNLLDLLGFVPATAVKVTPRLHFYVLKRGPLLQARSNKGGDDWLWETQARLSLVSQGPVAGTAVNTSTLLSTLKHFRHNFDAEVTPTGFAISIAHLIPSVLVNVG